MNQHRLVLRPPDNGSWSSSAWDFASGRPYVHPTGEEVRFHDDTWLIQVKSGAIGGKSINLRNLVPWLREPGRVFLAKEWLSSGKSTNTVFGLYTSLCLAGRLLGDLVVPSILDLTDAHAREFYEQLTRAYQDGQEALAAAAAATPTGMLAPRERRRILRQAGGLRTPIKRSA